MMKLILILCFVITTSCVSKKTNTVHNKISIEKISCGSYKVMMNEKEIGYVVKPIYSEFENEKFIEKELLSFESTLFLHHSNHYQHSLRVYHFTSNSQNDTVLNVVMLSSKSEGVIPNWKCEYQDVDMYSGRHKSTKKHPDIFYFNCSKNQFDNSAG